jgi:protein ImuA
MKSELIEKLQQEILSMQGLRPACAGERLHLGLDGLENAFPNGTFPVAAVHEFLSPVAEDAAATVGFMTGLLSHLLRQDGFCLWAGTSRTVFPAALKTFGIEPDRIIFIDLSTDREVLWAMEEALKCTALAAVVGELREINLTESRRLQLAVEKSRVTGFLHRRYPRKIDNISCVSRWQISPVASGLEDGVPGIGHPQWNVQLLKIRNGKPGSWQVQWAEGRFTVLGHQKELAGAAIYIPKTG